MVRGATIIVTQVHGYNGDGLLVAQNLEGVEMVLTWDQALALPQVLATSNGLRGLYGLERLAVVQAGAWCYPQHDAPGSVRQWTDALDAVVGMQGYAPFGEPLVPLGPPVEPWGRRSARQGEVGRAPWGRRSTRQGMVGRAPWGRRSTRQGMVGRAPWGVHGGVAGSQRVG